MSKAGFLQSITEDGVNEIYKSQFSELHEPKFEYNFIISAPIGLVQYFMICNEKNIILTRWPPSTTRLNMYIESSIILYFISYIESSRYVNITIYHFLLTPSIFIKFKYQ